MTERELSRAAARRLAIIRHVEEVSGSVAMTCRYYGISRTLYYTWRRRYEELGIDGLRPRSRRPHTSPNATTGEVIGKIVHLRQNYHFGPRKISMYADRCEVRCPAEGLTHQALPVHRDRRLHPAARAAHLPQAQPADRHPFLDYVLERLPFRVEVIQTDNGAEFGSQFHYHVLDAGVGHVYIKPATPRLNGKVERSHRIDADEFYRMLQGVVVDEAQVFDAKLQEWERFYNFDRPHGALGGQTPYERLRQSTQTRV